MRVISFIIFIVIICLGITFAILNAAAVNLDYYFATVKISLSLLLVFTLAIGAIIGILVTIIPIIKLKAENRMLKHKNKQFGKEIENLRAIPIKDNH